MTELHRLTLTQAVTGLQERRFSISELVKDCLRHLEEIEPNINACITVMAEEALKTAARLDETGPDPDQPLWGVPVTVEDMFCTKDARTTGASKMLENFTPCYDAHLVTSLKKAGAVILAKTNLDEFALGTTGKFSFFGPTRNPWDSDKTPGGSSSGAAASVAAYQSMGAFGIDTGGGVRQPAARCGCVSLKPTYGRISRYGLYPVAGSFDQAAPVARRVSDLTRLLVAVAGPDHHDGTASPRPVDDYTTASPANLKGLKLGLVRELWEGPVDQEVATTIKAAACQLEEAGATLIYIDMPNLRYAPAAHNILTAAEASTNLARFDGVRFGYRSEKARDLYELYTASRSESLGPEVQRRIILGTFVLSADSYEPYFLQAARVRRLVRDDYYQALGKCDFILSPVNTETAQDLIIFDKDQNQNQNQNHDLVGAVQSERTTLPENMSGLPALVFPVGLSPKSGLPVGLQLTGPAFAEKNLLSAGLALEEIFSPLL